ncbi:MAG: hypothetical protein ACUVSI_04000 [Actinomycetota bacterium]
MAETYEVATDVHGGDPDGFFLTIDDLAIDWARFSSHSSRNTVIARFTVEVRDEPKTTASLELRNVVEILT